MCKWPIAFDATLIISADYIEDSKTTPGSEIRCTRVKVLPCYLTCPQLAGHLGPGKKYYPLVTFSCTPYECLPEIFQWRSYVLGGVDPFDITREQLTPQLDAHRQVVYVDKEQQRIRDSLVRLHCYPPSVVKKPLQFEHSWSDFSRRVPPIVKLLEIWRKFLALGVISDLPYWRPLADQGKAYSFT